MATLRLFGPAREAAGVGRDRFDADSVESLLRLATARYPADFATVLESCRVWVNGDDVGRDHRLTEEDEVAVIPPISGG